MRPQKKRTKIVQQLNFSLRGLQINDSSHVYNQTYSKDLQCKLYFLWPRWVQIHTNCNLLTRSSRDSRRWDSCVI